MMTLFDDEYILRTYIESERREAAEKAAEKASQKTAQKTAQKLYAKGNTVADIADTLDVSVEDVEKWLGLVPM